MLEPQQPIQPPRSLKCTQPECSASECTQLPREALVAKAHAVNKIHQNNYITAQAAPEGENTNTTKNAEPPNHSTRSREVASEALP